MSEQMYRAFWEEALKQIKEQYKSKGQEDDFKLWFNMEYLEDTISQIKVAVPSEFMWTRMVSMGYVSAVENMIEELSGQNISITYEVKNKNLSKPAVSETPVQKTEPEEVKDSSENLKNDTSVQVEQSKTAPAEHEIKSLKLKHPQLREDYTFDTFVAGDNSAFAYNASLAVAKNPGRAYNPILIYGGVGLGKTHLMQSIGNYIYNEKGEDVKICYVSAENFTNEFLKALENKTTEKFKSKYRKLDVLLLDDIHFLQGKEATQEELFHTFEALYNNKSQMVFTCDRPITELKGIEDRLRTRFSRGMSIDLTPPNYETRRAILQKKIVVLEQAQNKSIPIPSEVIDYIAKNIQTNVRDLESCLTKMIGYTELIGKPLTIDIAQEQLRDTFSQPANGSVSIETIQKVVAEHYNISLSDIKSKKRNKKFVVPRQIAIYIARNLLDYSFPELGNEFGGRDHTTMMHSYEKVEDQIKTDSLFDTTIQMLIREVKDYKK